MNFKIPLASALIFFFMTTGVGEAYDLPKVFVEKKISEKKEQKPPIRKSDWTAENLFEKKIKLTLAENPDLPGSSPHRVGADKNNVFIAFYKGNAYFLDRYSVKVVQNSSDTKSWKQRIFAIGEKVSSKNAKAILQKFSFDGEKYYNSLKSTNDLNSVENEEDKKFLTECFKVGYYYAFNEDCSL